MSAPIVMISSYPPRLCGIGTFCEEAREFIQKHNPEREVLVISHTDGSGEGVIPLIDMSQRKWWKPVAEKLEELQPYAVHLQHEYGLYEYYDERGRGDANEGFIYLLDAISDWPTIVEPHTVHGRMREPEADFIYKMCHSADVVLFKCHYQKWRLEWSFPGYGWKAADNIMIVPHGARPDRRYRVDQVPLLRQELGLDEANGSRKMAEHVVGLIGWIQSNKRWDILTSMWEDIAEEIKECTGTQWDLLAAGTIRDPNHQADYEKYVGDIQRLEEMGLAHYFEFIPRGDNYYKMMSLCDFIVLPSTDETQSGTLARIIALNKPYVTTAPMEGLTAQTLESGGGLLFTNKKMLREAVVRLACDEQLRMELGTNLEKYLNEVVSWDVVAEQYNQAYALAREANAAGKKVVLPREF
jgi:glycosyltransferase involved in cell wall biosynthesis